MAKQSIFYKCTECDATSPTWAGRCMVCSAWGTLVKVEDKASLLGLGQSLTRAAAGQVVNLNTLTRESLSRFKVGIDEVDRCLGGGVVPGSVILLGGDPGVGKSTLALQIAKNLLDSEVSILYVGGEESPAQIKLRAERLGLNGTADRLQLLPDTNLATVIATATQLRPDFIIVDSIQTLYNPDASGVPGSISQVSGAAARITEMAKQYNIATLIVGHVTKEGFIAGPKTLEHMVDVVLYLEGERFQQLRILRSVKNRFGAVNEIGVFEMTGAGLTEVANPSRLFLDEDLQSRSGAALTAVLEGSRVIACEIQALLSKSSLAYPKRTALGFDLNRLWLLLAVLGKYGRLPVYENDVYINVVGGLKIDEPAADLAVAAACASSILDKPIPSSTGLVGEVGLSAEIRPVGQIDRRLSELEKLGFEKVVIPAKQKVGKTKLELIRVGDISELLRKLFGKK